MAMRREFCPDCGVPTPQHSEKYDPDDPESAEIWVCNLCGEAIDFEVGEGISLPDPFKN